MIRVARNPSEEAAWGVLSKSELVKMREMRELTDLLIVSEEGISFYVHSLVLAAASLKLRNKIIVNIQRKVCTYMYLRSSTFTYKTCFASFQLRLAEAT
jgi:hypothetical protein